MKITYIGHSGFLMEWDSCYWLFDYYKGTLPKMDRKKKIFVFVSHNHGDHYNPEIFQLQENDQEVEYILSSDIRRKSDHDTSYSIISVKPGQEYELWDALHNKILLETLKSTDCGVAFLLHYQGKTVYHAGDLNLWVWKEEAKQYNNNMTANFQKEMERLKGRFLDIAFVPLDPRQEEWYDLGLNALLDTADIKYVFPMHFWDKYAIIDQYKQEHKTQDNTQIMDINYSGQQWRIEI